MDLEPRPLPVQTTGIRLSQHMKLSLRILQMAAPELDDFIREQTENNPFLEVERYAEWPGIPRGKRSAGAVRQDRAPNQQNIPAPSFESLENAVLHQLRLNGVRGALYRIASYLAGNLDEHGYLRIDTREAADHLRVPQDEVEQALKIVQSLEPAGIGARSLAECLLLQLERDRHADPFAAELVRRHLPDLAAGKLGDIAEALGISLERVKQILRRIQALNPRPVCLAREESSLYIVPDAEIRLQDGRIVIALNEHALPRVNIDAQMSNLLNRLPPRRADGTHAEFLEFYQYYQSAKGLVRALEQRKLTLKRVLAAIAEKQRPFLENGRTHLKPMSMEDVAGYLDLHVSTVSRTIRHKYVRTPHGLFALKFFFSRGFKTSHGQMIASESIKTRICDIIGSEDKENP